MPDLRRGAVFAGHRIEGVAGRGGMGVVYRATHMALDHVVALKVISPQFADDERFRRRFENESRIAVSIRHPNVVPVHHAGEEEGLLFVTMDLIEGTDLRGLLAQGPLEPEHAVRITSEVASALDSAHRRGLVHRDIKPANILIESEDGTEHVYLTDFGLSKRIEAESGLTASGAFVGTLDYVAPEQIKGERVDARADVYALGCVLYEMLTGTAPFATQTEKVAKMYAHLQEEPSRLQVWVPELSDELDLVVRRALEKEPAKRFPSTGDLARAAAAAVEGRPTVEVERSVATGEAAPVPLTTEEAAPSTAKRAASTAETAAAAEPATEAAPTVPAARRRPRARAGLIAALVVGVLAAGALAVVLTSSDDEEPAGEPEAAGGQPPAKVVSTIRIGGFPVELAHGEGGVWVTSRNGGILSLIAGEPGKEDTPVEIDQLDQPEGVAVGEDAVWVANAGTDEVVEVDPRQRTEVERILVGDKPQDVAVAADGGVWVSNFNDDTVQRIDPATLSVSDPVTVGDQPHQLAMGQGSLWVSDRRSDEVSRIVLDDPDTEAAAISVGDNPKGIAVARGLVWVANTNDDDVSVIDPTKRPEEAEIEKIPVGNAPRGVVSALGSIWVANGLGNSVSRIDPQERKEIETVRNVGTGPEGLTAGPENVWVANGVNDNVARIKP